MSLRNICLIPRGWTLADYGRHTCNDGSHIHLSAAQLRKYESEGTMRVLSRPNDKYPQTIAVRAAAYQVSARPVIRDASCYIGEYLAIALAEGLEWARAMRADIIRHHVTDRDFLPPEILQETELFRSVALS